jgi:hypothetical protein
MKLSFQFSVKYKEGAQKARRAGLGCSLKYG